MKNLLLIKLQRFRFLFFASYIFFDVNLLFAQEKIIHSLPIKDQIHESYNSSKILMPIPTGDINTSSTKVNYERNPFQNPSKSEFPTIENLYSSLLFKGLAQSKKKLVAIIETQNGQNFYEVGDSLENGFTIQSISLENTSVDISNGIKNYRLTLVDIEKLL